MDQFKVRAVHCDDNKLLISSRVYKIRKGWESAEVSKMLTGESVRNNRSMYGLVFLHFWREVLLEFNLTVVNVIS